MRFGEGEQGHSPGIARQVYNDNNEHQGGKPGVGAQVELHGQDRSLDRWRLSWLALPCCVSKADGTEL